MRSEARKRTEIRYRQKNVRQYALKFYRNTEGDIIDYIESLDNISGKIKELLRQEMKREGK